MVRQEGDCRCGGRQPFIDDELYAQLQRRIDQRYAERDRDSHRRSWANGVSLRFSRKHSGRWVVDADVVVERCELV
jgi:hypothetical protein